VTSTHAMDKPRMILVFVAVTDNVWPLIHVLVPMVILESNVTKLDRAMERTSVTVTYAQEMENVMMLIHVHVIKVIQVRIASSVFVSL